MKKGFLGLFLVVSILLSGCYLNDDVATDQVGVQLRANKVVDVVGPGVYSDGDFYSDLREVSVGTLTFSVTDPQVLTQDNQAVGITITIQARRKSDKDSVINLVTNWPTLTDDNNLIDTISATAKEGIKNGTRLYTLSTLLDDRNGLATEISEQIELDAEKYSVQLVNLTVENIEIDQAYTDILAEKARLRAETEKELERQKLITQQGQNDILQAQTDAQVLAEQLNVEKAKTDVEVEIASREGKKITEANKVYQTNTQAFELERLRLMREMFGEGTVYFIPQGSDISLFFNNNGTVVPISE